MRRESSTRAVKISTEQFAVVDAIPHPLGLNICASRNPSARLDLGSSAFSSGGDGGERALGKLRAINNLVSDARVGLIVSEGAVA
jgi:hypothetical protein